MGEADATVPFQATIEVEGVPRVVEGSWQGTACGAMYLAVEEERALPKSGEVPDDLTGGGEAIQATIPPTEAAKQYPKAITAR